MIAAFRFLLVAAAAVYAGICVYMYLQQRGLQYFPTNRNLNPSAAGLEGVGEEFLETPDGETIAAWYAGASPGRPTILFLHGNGGEIGDRARRMAFYLSQGFGALFVSYRGYGKSTGTISESGLVTDAVTAHAWLVKRGVAAHDIAVVGESLGTGVGVQLAARHTIAALALEAPYVSAADIAQKIYWWLPVRMLMKDTFDSKNYIGKVKVPLLIQHGDSDGIIPVEHGKNLFAMANEPKELEIIQGAGHDVIHDQSLWQRELDFFLRRIERQSNDQ